LLLVIWFNVLGFLMHSIFFQAEDGIRVFHVTGVQTCALPILGKLIFIRFYSGELTAGSYVFNSSKNRKERIGRILRMHANHREEIGRASCRERGVIDAEAASA